MVLTPQDARQLVDSIKKIEKSIRSIQGTLGEVLRTTHRDFEGLDHIVEKIGKTGIESMDQVGKASEETVKLMTSSWTDFSTKVGESIDSIKRKMDEIDRHPAVKGIFGNPDGPGALSGKAGGLFSGMGTLAKNMQSEVMSVLPVGGLLGLLLGGANLNIDTNVLGAKMLGTFQASLRSTSIDTKAFGDEVKVLENTFGKASDIANRFGTTLNVLSQSGISEDEALKKMSGSLGGLGKNTAEALTGLDIYFGMASGRSAEMAIKMTQDLGMNLQDATLKLQKLGDSFRGNGASVETFVGTLLQASSSLRMQVTDVDDLAKTYAGLHDSIARLTPGMSPQAVTLTSLKAFSGLTNSIAGFGDVQKAFLGRAMGLGNGDPFSAIQKFELGAAGGLPGGSTQFLTQLVPLMIQLGKNQGGTDPGRLEHVFKTSRLFHLPDNVAMALANVSGSGAQPGTPAFQDAIKSISTLLEKQKDPMQALVENLQRVVATLGAMLLSLLSTTVNTLISVGAAIIAAMHGDTRAGDIIGAARLQAEKSMTGSRAAFADAVKTTGLTGLDLYTKALGSPVVSQEDVDRVANQNPNEKIRGKTVGQHASEAATSTGNTLANVAKYANPVTAITEATEGVTNFVLDILGAPVGLRVNVNATVMPHGNNAEQVGQ